MLAIIRSWGDSLKLLAPSSLKEWGLLTLKGSLESYKIVIKYFWWLLLAMGVLPIWASYYITTGSQSLSGLQAFYFYFVYYVFFLSLAKALWFLGCLLAVRPSIAKKDVRYFVGYWAHALVALGIAIGVELVWFAVVNVYLSLLPETSGIFSYVPYYGKDLVKFLVLFILFFLFDTQLSLSAVFKSIWNGIKLIWYTLPLSILICCAVYVLHRAMHIINLEFGTQYDITTFLSSLVLPVYLSFLMYIYIKQIHEHPERYV